MWIYFKIAFRHLWHNRLFSFINIVGLSLGITSCLIILSHVRFELGYDQFHVNKERIVRITNLKYGDSFSPMIMATVMPEFFPEIEKTVRIVKADGSRFYIIQDKNAVEEKDLIYADSAFFSVFTFPLLSGDVRTVLRSPDRILLSESMARKYFGSGDPTGMPISLRISNISYQFIIEGIFRDFPGQSHFHANFLTSMEFFKKIRGERAQTSWGLSSVSTYILMKNSGMQQAIEQRMPQFINKYAPKDFAQDLQYTLQPLTRIHLYSKAITLDIEPQGSITRVIIFASVAILVLTIAMVNFVLLSMALAYQRIKEFGIRKIIGARQKELVSLIFAEFFIIFIFALQIAFMLVELTTSWLKSNINLNLHQSVFANLGMVTLYVAVTGIMGFLASVYIALFVSGVRPIDTIKGSLWFSNTKVPSRGVLVVFQFSIMISLVSCLIVMQKQIRLVRNTDLGFRKEQLLSVDLPDNSLDRYLLLKEELKKIPGVNNVSGAAYMPPSGQYWICNLKKPTSDTEFQLEEINSDFDFLETIGAELIQGRTFSSDFGTDTMAILINESGLRLLDIKDPLDAVILRPENSPFRSKFEVIGIFRDFHVRSLYDKVQPMVIFLTPGMVRQMAIRLAPSADKMTITEIEQKWKSIFPDDPIQYTYVDEALQLYYSREDQTFFIISLLTFLSFVIALMGIFGLSSFSAERQTKEIGIRKANGAMVSDIFYLLSKKIGRWIMIAFVIAIPISWFSMHRWLQHFAYRTEISWWIFILAFFISILVAGITICWRTYLAAIRNPVEALRYE
jgi:putative ABC transport system permease protein